MAKDSYATVRRALDRQRGIDRESLSSLQRYSGVSAASLSVADLARVVADVIKEERRDIIAHVNRLRTLDKIHDQREDERAKNLHTRLCTVESELRQLQKKGGPR